MAKHKHAQKRNRRPHAGSVGTYIWAIIIVLWGLLPFYWMPVSYTHLTLPTILLV